VDVTAGSSVRTQGGTGRVVVVVDGRVGAGVVDASVAAVAGVGGTVLDDSVLDETVLDETVLDDSVLDETVLGETVLDETVSAVTGTG
jgi:hypothetical protein